MGEGPKMLQERGKAENRRDFLSVRDWQAPQARGKGPPL